MYRSRVSKLTILAMAVFAFAQLPPTNPAKAEDIKIGAMRLGSAWYVFGATLSKLLKDNLPAGTNVEVIAKGGGVGNPISVHSKKSSIALANVATSVWAMNGHPVVYKGKKYGDIRALVGGLNSVWITAMVKEDYIAKTGNDTLEKILLGDKPVRIVMKPAGSSVPVVADMIMEAMGTNRDAIVKKGGEIIQVGAKQIPSLVRDNRADVYFESALKGHPAVTEASLTGNVRFVDLPDGVLEKLSKEGLNPVPLPKWFKGQSGPTKAVDLGTVIIAHKDMSDDMAYLITKTIMENKDAMASAHKAWSRFEPKEGGKLSRTGIPLHPGAAKYFKEKGLL